jgi:hypothetical protein
MSSGDSLPSACPVCGLTAGRAADCVECDWTLRTARRPGPVTARLRADFDLRLSAARRRFDARAAALVSADPGRLAPWIRGGCPDTAEWAAAVRDAAAATAGAVDEASACTTLAAALGALADDAVTVIVEIGPEGIGVTSAATDRLGTPLLRREQAATPWTALLPMLSAHDDERLFQLAGGIAGLDRDLLATYLANVVPSGAVAPGTAGETLVICQPGGWRLLEDAARQVFQGTARATLVRVAGLPTEESGLIGSLTARMPLLRGYGVVVATIAPATGAVTLGTRPLFRPGDVQGAESVLTLRRAPGDRDPTVLAVAIAGDAPSAGGIGIDGSALDVVSLHEVPLPDQPEYRVRAVLEAPGRVRFTEPRGVTPLTRPWTEVIAAIPHRVDVVPGPVDLVCALELAGEKKRVDRRRDLVRELLEDLADEYPDPDRLRVGLLGCTDHVFAPGEERRRVVRRQPLGAPAEALLALANFRGEGIRYPDAAPLEDMLNEAHRMLADSRAEGRSARLLLVAGRRAHPRILGPDMVQPCPFRCDWRGLTRGLAEAKVSVVAVVDAMPGRAARNGFWADIGRAGLHALPDTSAREVGADLGVSVRHGQRIGVPLPA